MRKEICYLRKIILNANLKGYFEVQKLNNYKYERFRYVFYFYIE